MSLEMENDNGDSLIKNEFTVSLEGGRPWGFTLQGGVDFRSPLKVGKVTAGGKAATAGLIAGDVIININGISTSSMKHHEAQRLIAASKTSLELTCTKNTPGSFLSPKSSTQLSTFEFPTRSSSHTRQRSLDFNFMRPRSSSDAGKRALVGENIAGIKVPAPPPSMRKRSESTVVRPAQETPVKYVAGIKVPPPPPSSTKSKSTGSAPFETTPGDQTLDINGPPIMTDSDVTQNDNDNSTTANVQSFNVELSSIEHIPATAQQEPTGTTSEAQVNDILSAIQSEFGSEDTSSSRNDDSTDDKDTLNESQTSGYKSIASSYEDDVVISNNGGNDWYRSMFQNMKKGVEEDLPNKKHVCDRSPVPPRKSILDEKENETSVASGASSNRRRSSESTLDLSLEHKSFGRTSSSGTVPDAVNTLNSGVVFRRNVQSFNQSRNYWKGIERQASQEKIELANKRNSLRRSSSATCTAPSLSPDSFKVPPKVPPKKSRASTSGVPEITEVFKETINLIADFESELERKSSVNSDSSDTTKSDTAANTETVKTDIDINTTPDTINTDVIQIIENDTTNTDTVNTEITKIDIANTDTVNTEITKIDIANTDTVNTEITKNNTTNTDTVNTEITEIDIANTANTDIIEIDFNTDTDIVKSTTPDMSKIHPLLRGSVDEGDQIEKIDDDIPQQDLFTRIDPSKLNNAIGNASVLGKMQQEGVDTLALQTTAISLAQQSQQEQPPPQKKKSKTIKEPPGKLAKALFDFEAASDKELSFKKDTVIELTETINADWLRGVIDGRTGMFPVSYVKVITENEIISLSQPEPDLNIFAKGLYNFEAKSPKELSFHKGDIITLLKKIDDNWYRGELQDNTGLVPVTYLQFFDPEQS